MNDKDNGHVRLVIKISRLHVIEAAITKAMTQHSLTNRGHALTRICQEYLEQHEERPHAPT